jgi:Protein of unknown function (DUF760)
MVFNSDFLNSQAEDEAENQLLNYLQHQSPDVLSRVAKSASPEIQQIISQNVQGLVGMLPSENFNVQITTDRENLAGLLASAMMTGYFLRQMEQRMELEETLVDSTSLRRQPHPEKKRKDSPKKTE